jgi:glutamate--cysteine ligase
VRLKTFLEQRGADGGPWNRLCALPAFWVGLLYDQSALDAAWDLVKDWTADERDAMRLGAAKHRAQNPVPQHDAARDRQRQALAISRAGLKARQRLNAHGENEALFLDDLDEIAKTGVSPAERLLERYHTAWNESVEPIFDEAAY